MNLDLRPLNFKEFIGQEKIKKTLQVMIKSAKVQNKPIDHILFYGMPGMGKTTLATIIANESDNNIHYVQGSNIEKKSDLISILSILKENDIVFIDEIHSINKGVVEFLYSAMDDFVFDLIIGAEGNSKAMRMKLKPFTLIGATTKLNEIVQPFKDRFGYLCRLSSYTLENMIEIIQKSSNALKIEIQESLIRLIAEYSRSTPRLANHLLKRINDFSISQEQKEIDKRIIMKTFKNLDLYEFGLTKDHIEYMSILKDGFEEKCVSLDTLCGLLLNSKENIINEIEPILLYLKLIEKNSRGRRITSKGIDYLIRQKLHK